MNTRIRNKAIWGFKAASRRIGLATVAACLVVVGGYRGRADCVVSQQMAPASAPAPAGVALPAGYVIGPEDVLSIVFWRDKDMSADVVVRPDGKISLPLLNDLQAAGLTPDQLQASIEKAASKFIAEPNATVIVKAINSRKVHIVGNVMQGRAPIRWLAT